MLTLYSWVAGVVRVQVILSRIFLIFPPYCLGSGLVHLMRNELMADFGRTIDANLYVNPFSLKIIGDRIIAMILLGLIGLIVTYILDLDLRFPNIFYKVKNKFKKKCENKKIFVYYRFQHQKQLWMEM